MILVGGGSNLLERSELYYVCMITLMIHITAAVYEFCVQNHIPCIYSNMLSCSSSFLNLNIT